MNKIPEDKTRKVLRITLCILYLFEVVFCAWPFINIPNGDGTKVISLTVLDMLSYIGQTPDSNGFQLSLPFFLLFPIIPLVGFFFCVFDRQRNLKNVVSLLCCLLGIIAVLFVVTPAMVSYGSLFAMLLYVLIAFISSFSMMAWIIANRKSREHNN